MEVFRSGDYGAKGRWTEEDLEVLANDYSPDVLEAPLTFDHARSGPAFGWVTRLRRVGDRLVATLSGVPEVVRELVRQGAYKKRSVELIRKFAPTGRPYLRAVTLLGAASPEVKGLRDVVFDEQAEIVCFEDAESGASAPDDNNGRADLEQQVTQLRRALRRKSLEVVLARVPKGSKRISPEGAQLLLAFVDALEPDATISYRGHEIGVEEWFEHYLTCGELEQPVEGELASFAGTVASSPVLSFGEQVDPLSVELHEQARALQASQPNLGYAEALSRVAGRAGGSRSSHARRSAKA
ncbi:Phage protein [Candidatus Sumerlaea chitinivorans]|uniref:Phage protein n=1 Tax=Sumerlaea chitinivorans TaxID=2250252 RepID=A0A2Z4Y7J7_SUMC1|nr:Phage protein [Candidatus Sumerlaea chitinivorans]